MTPMSRLLIAVALVATACGPASAPTTTKGAVITSPATTAPTTLQVDLQNCSSPPVTFSSLCEVFELVSEWHVDRPVDPSSLADIARRSLNDYIPAETAPPPRTLICAVPAAEFEEFCSDLAQLVFDTGTAVGPAVEHAVSAMTDLGLDPFTYYLTPELAGSFRPNGVVGGIGVLLDAMDAAGSKCTQVGPACPLEIVFVVEDNPGSEAGLLPGDQILEVDGVSVDGQGFLATAGAIAGDETGTVQIKIDRDGVVFDFTIERAELSVPTVIADITQSGVGYLRIPDFEDDIPFLVRQALDSINEVGPNTIVIDLRDNPGGFVDAVVAVASEFIDGGLVLESFGQDEHFEYPASLGGLATSQRLVVLVNQGTASAAEILAGALRDRRSAVVIGSNTFGKDAIQIPFDLRNGGELYVVVARWVSPNGESVSGGGLTPDRLIELPAGMTNEEVVEAALDAAS